jgi:hypothetical protein
VDRSPVAGVHRLDLRWSSRAPGGLSATLENEADATLENEATGSLCF